MGNRTADRLIDDLNKAFGSAGKPIAYYAREMPAIECRSTGSISLDFALGSGGFPTNRCVEIFGSEGSGKTTLALLVASTFIDAEPDRVVVFLDMEHKLTPEWMEQLVGPERMDSIIVAEPDTIEEASEMFRRIVPTGQVSVCILDSIGGAPTNMMFDETRDVSKKSDQAGGNAKGVTQFARFASNLSAKYNTLTIGINQVREKMNSRIPGVEQTPGGRGWKHACVMRVKLKKGYETIEAVVDGEKVTVGFNIIAQVVKNHVASGEGRTTEWKFFAQESEHGPVGIDTTAECIKLAMLTGIVERGGSYYSHPALPADNKGLHRVNGKKALEDAIREDASLRMTIVSEVMAALRSGEVDASEVAPILPIAPDEDDDRPVGAVGMGAVPPSEE